MAKLLRRRPRAPCHPARCSPKSPSGRGGEGARGRGSEDEARCSHLSRSEIAADKPLSLDLAARSAFPDGSMSGLALRIAATRTDLGHAKISGCVYTTRADIEHMVAT